MTLSIWAQRESVTCYLDPAGMTRTFWAQKESVTFGSFWAQKESVTFGFTFGWQPAPKTHLRQRLRSPSVRGTCSNCMSIEYSDGSSIENHIVDLLKNAADRGSLARICEDEYDNWAVRYHLTPERANLVRPFSWDGLDVLELGAGMGAVSRYLAENARSLYVVEGTQTRFNALEERLSGLTNWKGEVCNIQDFHSESRFDVVCVIGVLEYSELFINSNPGQSPFQLFLQHARQFLRPGGVLLLAIENQIGLKYFSGSAEDHSNQLFDGVVGYPARKCVRTFSRKGLRSLLSSSGFDHIDEFFPFPDYKVPTSVVSRKLIEESPQLVANLAGHHSFQNYGFPNVKFFPDALALETLAEAGCLQDFANSFVFIAGDSAHSLIRRRLLTAHIDAGTQGWHYSLNRRHPVVTKFQSSPAGGLEVGKQLLLNPNQATVLFPESPIGAVRWTAQSAEPASSALYLKSDLFRRAYFSDWNGFDSTLDDYLNWAFQNFGTAQQSLNGQAVDAVLTNATKKGQGDYSLFDPEWSLSEPISRSWFILRNIFQLQAFSPWLKRDASNTLRELYESACNRLGVASTFHEDLEKEAWFQSAATGATPALQLSRLEAVFTVQLGGYDIPRYPVHEHALRVDAWKARRDPGFVKDTAVLIRLLLSQAPRLGRMLSKVSSLAIRIARKLRNAFRYRRELMGWMRLFPQFEAWQTRGKPISISGSGFHRIRVWHSLPGTVSIEGFAPSDDAVPIRLQLPLKRSYGRKSDCLTRDLGPLLDLQIKVEPYSRSGFAFIKVSKLSRFGALLELARPIWDFRYMKPRQLLSAAQNLLSCLLRRQWGPARQGIKNFLFGQSVTEAHVYQSWVEKYATVNEADRLFALTALKGWTYLPRFSILMPTYNSDPRWLKQAIESVYEQWYPYWELCIADDASDDPRVKEILLEYQKKDPRIRVQIREENGHIAAASQTALEMAQEDFTAFLDHDDRLSPDALYLVAYQLNQTPGADLIYSDEDKIDEHNQRYDPFFKPDWNRELFYAYNYMTHFSVVRTSVLKSAGGFRPGYDGSQDYDLLLRVVDHTTPDKIQHIPFILYHWRAIPGSVALMPNQKEYAHEAARRALRSHLIRKATPAQVVAGKALGYQRVVYPLPEPLPKVSVIICTRDHVELLRKVIHGLLEQTDYPDLEICVVDNQSTNPKTLAFLNQLATQGRVRVLRYAEPFNFSKMNNWAVDYTTGSWLLFLNNDIEIVDPQWLKEMVRYTSQSDIGAVGAKLLYPDGRVQHAGITLGLHSTAGHSGRLFSDNEPGYFGNLWVSREVAAVTGACLLTPKALFLQLEGFNAAYLPISYNDVDYCLRVKQAKHRVVWTPFAKLVHHESASRGSDQVGKNRLRLAQESAWFCDRWQSEIEHDPAYNPNLSLNREDFALAFPPRTQKPWRRAPELVSKPLATKPNAASLTPLVESDTLFSDHGLGDSEKSLSDI